MTNLPKIIPDTEETDSASLSEVFASMTDFLFDQIPIPFNFIDTDGKVIIMNQAFLTYMGLSRDDVVGKHLTEIDPTVRLPIVAKTGHPEIHQKHRFRDGRQVIVHRLPLFHNKTLIGAAGIVLSDDLSYINAVTAENKLIHSIKGSNLNKIKAIYKSKYIFDDILTNAPSGIKCKEDARIYAKSNFSVLITGESGVGKELFAHSIHASSQRKDGPFVRVNCAAIPESLIESELFGYDQGAFTGANKGGKIGKFELADGGTIFLDEIADFPLLLQTKLLRVLQEKELEKVGSNEIILLDVRVIAATNCNLEQRVKDGLFRADLYYRLNVLSLAVPSLKERREDIPLLINHFSTMIYQEFNFFKEFPQDVVSVFQRYPWPGNVRELKNIIDRLSVNSPHQVVTISDIPDMYMSDEDATITSLDLFSGTDDTQQLTIKQGTLKESLDTVERAIIKQFLKQSGGNKAQAAKLLDIPRMTLYRKIKEYNI